MSFCNCFCKLTSLFFYLSFVSTKRKKTQQVMFLSTSSVFHKFNNNSSKNQPYHHNHFFASSSSTRPHFLVSSLHCHNSTIFVSFTLCLAIISKTKIIYEIKYHIETKSLNGGTVKHTNVAFFISINIFVLHLYFSSLRLYFTFL